MALKDLKPQSVSDFLHKASSFLGMLAAGAYTIAQVPFPMDFKLPSLLIYGTGIISALGFGGALFKKS